MSGQHPLRPLIEHLTKCSALTSSQAEHIVAEVLAFLDETPEAFIRRRHAELQANGFSNTEIFPLLQTELEERRFSASNYSERQLRRLIYG